MTQAQQTLASGILYLKQAYEAIVNSLGGSSPSAAQLAQLNSLHQNAASLSTQLINSGYTGPPPESQDAAAFAASIASYAAAGGLPPSTTSTSTTSTSTSNGQSAAATASGGGFSGWLSSVFGGLGAGVNTVTGATGQARATAWIGILTPFIIILAIAAFLAHHFSAHVAVGGGGARPKKALL